MRRRLLVALFVFAASVLAQNPPANPPTTTTDPTGRSCTANSVLNYVPSGTLFSCDATKHYAQITAGSAPPSGPCGGDLGGTFPNCTVKAVTTNANTQLLNGGLNLISTPVLNGAANSITATNNGSAAGTFDALDIVFTDNSAAATQAFGLSVVSANTNSVAGGAAVGVEGSGFCVNGTLGCVFSYGIRGYGETFSPVSFYVAAIYGAALNAAASPIAGKIAGGYFTTDGSAGAARTAGVATETILCGPTTGACAGVYVGAIDCGTTVGDCVSFYGENPTIPTLYAEGWTTHEGHTFAEISARGPNWENGSTDFCNNCTVTSAIDDTCIAGGSGGATVNRTGDVNHCAI